MSLKFGDRVKETTTTTGTGTYSLAGAVSGFQAFTTVLSNGDTCYYAATDTSGNWEIGLGTFTTSGTTLARTSVLASSNSGSAVSWASGSKTIWLDLPASFLSGLMDLTSTQTANGAKTFSATIIFSQSSGDAVQSNGYIRVFSNGSNGVILDGSGLSPTKNDWNLKQGSDGTFLFDQGGGMSGRFKLGGTGAGTFYDFTPDYSSSYLKVADSKAVTTFNNTLDDGSGNMSANGVAIPTISSTSTLTNKRVTPRTGTTTSSATPTINTDNVDLYTLTAMSAAVTSMTTNLSGTPSVGQELMLGFKDNSTARAITWGASFVSSGVATLLATTSAGKQHWVKLMWDGSHWACMAVDATGY